MIFAKAVRSKTLKGGVDAVLGPCTLLLGPNGSGKSRVVNAVEYGFTGKVSDIRGRALAAEAVALKSLGVTIVEKGDELDEVDDAPRGRKMPKVSIDLAQLDGNSKETPGIRIEGEGKSAPFPNAMLLRDVEDAVAGSAATLRKFLVRHAVGELQRDDVLARLPAARRTLYADMVVTGVAVDGSGDGELNALIGIIASAQSLARKAAGRAKDCETKIRTAPQCAIPSMAELTAADSAITDAQDALEKRIAAQATAGAVASARVSRMERRAALHKQREGLLERNPWLKSARPPEHGAAVPPPFTDAFRRNMECLRQLAADDAGKCLVCGAEYGSDPGHFKDRLTKVENIMAEREFHMLTAQLREYDDLHSSGSNIADAEAITAEIPTARRILNEARMAKAQLEENARAWQAIDVARAQVKEYEAAETRYKELAEDCSTALKGLFGAGRLRFAEKVQTFLPAGDRFGLDLTETRIDFGLLDDAGDLRTALSGAEWARVMGAMALACAAAGSSDGPASPRILALPDRALDAVTLSNIMEAWRELPRKFGIQVLICAVVAPIREVDGWTVVKTGELQGSNGAARAPKAQREAPTVI